MKDARRTQTTESLRRRRKHRAELALITNYIHELSERHGPVARRPATAKP